MSHEMRPYSPFYIRAWTGLTIVLSLLLLSCFVFGNYFLDAGKVVWHLLRWICSPII